jgi:hypothetical protein
MGNCQEEATPNRSVYLWELPPPDVVQLVLRMAEEEVRRIPSKGWVEMIYPAALLRELFRFLDSDRQPGISFFREREYRFRP